MPKGKKTKVVQVGTDENRPKTKPATTEKGREKEMIRLAVNLAEQQLRDGTASAQVITHYLKLGTERERLEVAIKKKEEELIAAKTEALKAAKHVDELYANAIAAMRRYNGDDSDDIHSRISRIDDGTQ